MFRRPSVCAPSRACVKTASLVSLLTALAVLSLQRPVHGQAQERQAYVSAFDASGGLVRELAADDVMIREDGVRREVLRIQPATAPMQIAILIDNSQAASPAINDLRNALPALIDRMAGKNDIALVAYGDRPTILVDYTQNAELLRKGVSRIFAQPGSGAYMLDAIIEASRGLRKREAQRPVMLVIGGEGTEFSNRNYEPVLQELHQSGASLHMLFLSPAASDGTSDEIRSRNIVMDRGTRETGGRRDNLLTSMAFAGKLKEVADELSNQHLVTYARPRTLIPPEKIEVTSAKPGLVVRGTVVRQPAGTR